MLRFALVLLLLSAVLFVSAGTVTVVVVGVVLGTWATLVNKCFSAVVRIQRERGHTTVQSLLRELRENRLSEV